MARSRMGELGGGGGKGGFRRFKMVRGGGGLLGDLRWGERGFVSVVIGDVWRLKGLVFAWMLLCLLGFCCVCLDFFLGV